EDAEREQPSGIARPPDGITFRCPCRAEQGKRMNQVILRRRIEIAFQIRVFGEMRRQPMRPERAERNARRAKKRRKNHKCARHLNALLIRYKSIVSIAIERTNPKTDEAMGLIP